MRSYFSRNPVTYKGWVAPSIASQLEWGVLGTHFAELAFVQEIQAPRSWGSMNQSSASARQKKGVHQGVLIEYIVGACVCERASGQLHAVKQEACFALCRCRRRGPVSLDASSSNSVETQIRYVRRCSIRGLLFSHCPQRGLEEVRWRAQELDFSHPCRRGNIAFGSNQHDNRETIVLICLKHFACDHLETV